jgi:hypothetical protein
MNIRELVMVLAVFWVVTSGSVLPKTCNSLLGRCTFAKRMHARYIYSSCECGSVFDKHCGDNTIFVVNFPSPPLIVETADSSAMSIISTTVPACQV